MPEIYEDLLDLATGEHLGMRSVLGDNEMAKTKPTSKQKEGWEYVQNEILPLPHFLQEQFGNFIHSRYDALLRKVDYDTATAFRFIYLCTFMEYDTGYIIWKNKKINEHYLIDIFNVHKNTITPIKKKLFDYELVFKDENEKIYVNMDYCYRGDISNNKSYRQQCTRIFNNGIQDLYNKTTDPHDHKMLGKLILILPYVNIYHNIICMNTKEKDFEKLVVPNISQMDEILHSSHRNSTRQINMLLELEVNGEPAVLVVNHKNTRMFALNPRVYYGGTRLSDVKELSGWFKVKGGLD